MKHLNEFDNLTDFTKDIFCLKTKINFSTSAYKKDYLEFAWVFIQNRFRENNIAYNRLDGIERDWIPANPNISVIIDGYYTIENIISLFPLKNSNSDNPNTIGYIWIEYWEYDSNGNYVSTPYKERNPQLYYQNSNKIIYQLVY